MFGLFCLTFGGVFILMFVLRAWEGVVTWFHDKWGGR